MRSAQAEARLLGLAAEDGGAMLAEARVLMSSPPEAAAGLLELLLVLARRELRSESAAARSLCALLHAAVLARRTILLGVFSGSSISSSSAGGSDGSPPSEAPPCGGDLLCAQLAHPATRHAAAEALSIVLLGADAALVMGCGRALARRVAALLPVGGGGGGLDGPAALAVLRRCLERRYTLPCAAPANATTLLHDRVASATMRAAGEARPPLPQSVPPAVAAVEDGEHAAAAAAAATDAAQPADLSAWTPARASALSSWRYPWPVGRWTSDDFFALEESSSGGGEGEGKGEDEGEGPAVDEPEPNSAEEAVKQQVQQLALSGCDQVLLLRVLTDETSRRRAAAMRAALVGDADGHGMWWQAVGAICCEDDSLASPSTTSMLNDSDGELVTPAPAEEGAASADEEAPAPPPPGSPAEAEGQQEQAGLATEAEAPEVDKAALAQQQVQLKRWWLDGWLRRCPLSQRVAAQEGALPWRWRFVGRCRRLVNEAAAAPATTPEDTAASTAAAATAAAATSCADSAATSALAEEEEEEAGAGADWAVGAITIEFDGEGTMCAASGSVRVRAQHQAVGTVASAAIPVSFAAERTLHQDMAMETGSYGWVRGGREAVCAPLSPLASIEAFLRGGGGDDIASCPAPNVYGSAAVSMRGARRVVGFTPMGLDNLGQTCYQNSVLQSLFATGAVRNALLGSLPGLKAAAGASEGAMSAFDRLKRARGLFARLACGNANALRPQAWWHSLPEFPWREGTQEDASEFLMFVLSTLQDGAAAAADGAIDTAKFSCFCGTQRSKRRCAECDRVSSSDEIFDAANVVKFPRRFRPLTAVSVVSSTGDDGTATAPTKAPAMRESPPPGYERVHGDLCTGKIGTPYLHLCVSREAGVAGADMDSTTDEAGNYGQGLIYDIAVSYGDEIPPMPDASTIGSAQARWYKLPFDVNVPEQKDDETVSSYDLWTGPVYLWLLRVVPGHQGPLPLLRPICDVAVVLGHAGNAAELAASVSRMQENGYVPVGGGRDLSGSDARGKEEARTMDINEEEEHISIRLWARRQLHPVTQLSLVQLDAYDPQQPPQLHSLASRCNPLRGNPLDVADLQADLTSGEYAPGLNLLEVIRAAAQKHASAAEGCSSAAHSWVDVERRSYDSFGEALPITDFAVVTLPPASHSSDGAEQSDPIRLTFGTAPDELHDPSKAQGRWEIICVLPSDSPLRNGIDDEAKAPEADSDVTRLLCCRRGHGCPIVDVGISRPPFDSAATSRPVEQRTVCNVQVAEGGPRCVAFLDNFAIDQAGGESLSLLDSSGVVAEEEEEAWGAAAAVLTPAGGRWRLALEAPSWTAAQGCAGGESELGPEDKDNECVRCASVEFRAPADASVDPPPLLLVRGVLCRTGAGAQHVPQAFVAYAQRELASWRLLGLPTLPATGSAPAPLPKTPSCTVSLDPRPGRRGRGALLPSHRIVKAAARLRFPHCAVALGATPLSPHGVTTWRMRVLEGAYYYLGVAMAPVSQPLTGPNKATNAAECVNLNSWLGADEYAWSFYSRDDRSRSGRAHDGEANGECGPHLAPGDILTLSLDCDAGTLTARFTHEGDVDRPLGVIHDNENLRAAIAQAQAAVGTGSKQLHIAVGVSADTAVELLPELEHSAPLTKGGAAAAAEDAEEVQHTATSHDEEDSTNTGTRDNVLSLWHPGHPEHPLIWIDGLDEYYCDLCSAESLENTFRCPCCNFDLCTSCAMLDGDALERAGAHSVDIENSGHVPLGRDNPAAFPLCSAFVQPPQEMQQDGTGRATEIFDWSVTLPDPAAGGNPRATVQGSSANSQLSWAIESAEELPEYIGPPRVSPGWWHDECIVELVVVVDGEVLPGDGFELIEVLGGVRSEDGHFLCGQMAQSAEEDTIASTDVEEAACTSEQGSTVSEEDVAMIMAVMGDAGITEQQARKALLASNGSIDLAMSMIFDLEDDEDADEDASEGGAEVEQPTEQAVQQSDQHVDAASPATPPPAPPVPEVCRCSLYARRRAHAPSMPVVTDVCFAAEDAEVPEGFERLTKSAGGRSLVLALRSGWGHICARYSDGLLPPTEDGAGGGLAPLLGLSFFAVDSDRDDCYRAVDEWRSSAMGDAKPPAEPSCAAISFAHHRLSGEQNGDAQQGHDCMVLVCHRHGSHPLEAASTLTLRDRASPPAGAGARVHYEVAFAVIGVVASAEMVHGAIDVQSDLCSPSAHPDVARQTFVGIVKRDQPATTCHMLALCRADSVAQATDGNLEAPCSLLWTQFNTPGPGAPARTAWGAWLHCGGRQSPSAAVGVVGAPDDSLRLTVRTRSATPYPHLTLRATGRLPLATRSHIPRCASFIAQVTRDTSCLWWNEKMAIAPFEAPDASPSSLLRASAAPEVGAALLSDALHSRLLTIPCDHFASCVCADHVWRRARRVHRLRGSQDHPRLGLDHAVSCAALPGAGNWVL